MLSRFFQTRTVTAPRAAAVDAVALVGSLVYPAVAHADLDNARVLVLDGGNTIEVAQADTSIQWYPPLDSSPLSAEFFADGTTIVTLAGPDADAATGTRLTVGYQIGYPLSVPGATATLTTPGVDVGVDNGADLSLGTELPADPVSVGMDVDLGTGTSVDASVVPEQHVTVDLEPGGITDVPIVEDREFDGATLTVRFAGIHGAVSGAVGPVTIRPYAKVVTASNDVAITYGKPSRS
ncbi:MspA family porin [Rhodococcus yananensis]|uniref:MspA family porin n=1 Tax=Rhodococcus yananensis TaxID=2879464 RepID=UPI001CF8AA1F|nr:MspA family porin [Rhodococcus yananensis]